MEFKAVLHWKCGTAFWSFLDAGSYGIGAVVIMRAFLE
jgi:hypothetical protein